jgi:hypothetical protein
MESLSSHFGCLGKIMPFLSNHVIHVKSCHSCQFMSNHVIHVIYVKSCHVIYLMCHWNFFELKFSKVERGGEGGEGRGKVKYVFL